MRHVWDVMRNLKPTILFVDDEALSRRIFRKIAAKEFNVLDAASVDEAISVLEKHSDDIGVLLSDQRMPGGLGVDLLEHCRKHYPQIVRMLTTAYSELNDAIAAVNRGEIMRYIEKPWGNINGLLIELRLAMSLYQMRAENDQLMAEKLISGFKTSRMDKIRTLITIAASQPGQGNLKAIEAMLSQLAPVDAFRQTPPVESLRNYEAFGQPRTDILNAIEIGEYLIKQTPCLITEKSWEVLRTTLAASKIHLEHDESGSFMPSPTLANTLISAKTALCERSEGKATAKVSFNRNGSVVSISSDTGPTSVLLDWMTSTTLASTTNNRIAALLSTFLRVNETTGRVHLNIAKDGQLNEVHLHFYESGDLSDTLPGTPDFDWIDDLVTRFM